MSKTKKIIALIMCIAIAASMLCIPSLAVSLDNPDNYAKYRGWLYSSFGDSIPAGFDKYEHSSVVGYAEVAGSYPQLVGTALGAVHCPFSCIGFRTNELLVSLGEKVEPDYYSLGYTSWMCDENGYCNYWDTTIAGCVAYSQLMTINIGNNDVFTAPLFLASTDVIDAGNEWAKNEEQINAALADGSLCDKLASILSLMNKLGYYDDYIPAVVSEMYAGYQNFKVNFPRIIEKLRSVNTYGDILVVGMYNPYESMTLTSNGLLKIGKAGDLIVDSVNNWLIRNAAKYGYTYVDVTGTETFADVNGTSLQTGLGEDAHPTAAGHEYMAQQILNALPVTEKKLPFKDVSEDAWYYDSVKYVYNAGIMQGATNELFAPGVLVTRAQMAAILYRMAGYPDVSNLTEPFVDVPNSHWAHDAIVWAYNEGVINGFTPHSFMPAASVSRGQMVTMLYRYAGSPAVSSQLGFKDAKLIPAAYKDAVAWASGNGFVNGYQDGFFHAGFGISRAEMSAIIARFCQK